MADTRLVWEETEEGLALDQTDEGEAMEAPGRWRRGRVAATLVAAALGALALVVAGKPVWLKERRPDPTGAMVSVAHSENRSAPNVSVRKVLNVSVEGPFKNETTTSAPGEKKEKDEVAEGEATLEDIIESTQKQLDDLESEIDRLTHEKKYSELDGLGKDVKRLEGFLEGQKNLRDLLRKTEKKLASGNLEEVQSLVNEMLNVKCLSESEAKIQELEKKLIEELELGHSNATAKIERQIEDLHGKCEKDSAKRASDQPVLAN
jgi:HPt (histidine-containing phosphotransfer) domain-containing protein